MDLWNHRGTRASPSGARSTFAEGPPLATRPLEWRAWLMAAVVCVAVFDPTRATIYGPFVCALVYLAGRPLKLRFDMPNCLALAFPGFAATSSLWSVNPGASWRAALVYTAVAVMFVVARDAIRTVRQARALVVGYLAGCFVLVVKILMAPAAASGQRLSLDTMNVNYAGYALAAGFAMVALLWVTKRRTLRRTAVMLGTVAALTVGSLLADTRGALLGLGLMAVWLLACWAFSEPPLRWLVTLTVILAGTIVSGAANEASLILEAVMGRATGDWSGRLVLWPAARAMWGEHLLIGAGADTFRLSSFFGMGAHNLILELGTGLGIVGVTVYVGLLWSSLGKRTTSASQTLGPLLIGCFIATSVLSYLTGVWDSAPAAWLALAVFSRIGVLGQDPEMSWRADTASDRFEFLE